MCSHWDSLVLSVVVIALMKPPDRLPDPMPVLNERSCAMGPGCTGRFLLARRPSDVHNVIFPRGMKYKIYCVFQRSQIHFAVKLAAVNSSVLLINQATVVECFDLGLKSIKATPTLQQCGVAR